MDRIFAENNFQAVYSPAQEIRYPDNRLHKEPGTDMQVVSPAQVVPLGILFSAKKKYDPAKRCFDILLSALLILGLLSWLTPLIALLIKLSSRGPVFFRQRRNGNAGKPFTCIKFRTMLVNEESDLTTAKINDQRITGLGKFLRRHHLDELPQFFNVLMGNMSVVGPRPYMVRENIYYESRLENYSSRHSIKPGITGLAQSYGYFGSIHDMENAQERFDLDMQYIYHRSFGMDMKILCRTIGLVFGIKFRYAPAAGS